MKKEYRNSGVVENNARTILVVEDDAALLRLIQKSLQRAGFNTEGYFNGTEAISRIVNSKRPELLILDYCLPDMTGKQVIETLAQKKRETPFIVVTGHGGEKVAVEMMKLGARDYLVKDVAFLDLLPSVTKQVFKQIALEKQLSDAEKAQRESEKRLKSYLESSPDGIYVHDLESRFLYINSAAERIMGYSKQELLGKSLKELPVLPPEYWSKARLLHGFSEFGRPGGPDEFELVRKDGSRIFIEVSTYPMAKGDKTEVISVARDITERKRMEEALRCREEYFRSLIENSQDAMVIVDGDGTISYGSPSVERMLGYKLGELIGAGDLFRFAHSDDIPSIIKIFGKLMENPAAPVKIELRIRHKDGSWRVIEAVANNLLTDPAVKGIVINWRDVTERKHAEDVLRESEERFRRLVEDMNDGYIVVQDSKVVFANARSAEMFRYTPEEVVGKYVEEFLIPEVGEALVDLHARRLRREAVPQQYEMTVTKKDGTPFTVEFGAKLIAYGGRPAVSVVIRDVTERKQMEEALRQSESNYRILFESTLDGLFVIDGETLQVVFGNEVAAQTFGFDSVEEAIEVNPLDFLFPEDRSDIQQIIAVDVLEKGLHEVHEFRAKKVDGREIWISAVGTRIKYQGRLAALISVRDITEHKKADEEKQRLEQQLHLASRLAAVGELAAGVAHELNNPLAAIQGFAQFLATKNDIDETIRKDLDTVYREAQRASRITQNLLSFARKHEPEKRLISLNEVLEKTLELRTHQMKVNNIELTTELQTDLPMTMADFYQMQQVFMNIIVNAEQAMVEAHGGGNLLIKTQKLNGMVRTSFTDDGPGISEENLKCIFDPFFTTKKVGKGTGLGLSICYGLVEGHGGRIYAKSKLGKGATFVVEIPRVSESKPG